MGRTRWLVGALALAVLLPVVAAPVSKAARPAAPPPSPFELRGIVEGSYGPAWSHDDRLDAIRWMGGHGMNMYVHAPKSDRHQRYDWRDPYPPDEMADFAGEIAAGRTVGVDWVPNVSPGVPALPAPVGTTAVVSRDICFSCPTDLDALMAKFQPFIDAGARTVMLSFDDVRMVSTHAEDALAYGHGDAAYAQMNHDVINALDERLTAARPGARLLTVLPQYSGTTDTEYLAAFRARGPLHEGVTVLWTGAYVLSHDIPTRDAADYARLVGVDRIGIWDNYPANDLAGNAVGATRRLFLGPYEGRDPDLDRAASGVLINVMNEAWASRVALGTVSRYLADPTSYEPEAAWRISIADLGGGDVARTDAIAALAENSRSSMLDDAESPVFSARANALLDALDDTAFWTQSYAALVDEAHREARAVEVLRQSFPALRDEADRFLDRLAQNAAVIEAGADLLARQQPWVDVRRRGADVAGCARHPNVRDVTEAARRLEVAQAATARSTGDLHGDRASPTFGGPKVAQNRVDAFYRTVSLRHARWLPTAASAASSITVTVDGAVVPLEIDGCFRLAAGAPVTVIAIDGAGRTAGARI